MNPLLKSCAEVLFALIFVWSTMAGGFVVYDVFLKDEDTTMGKSMADFDAELDKIGTEPKMVPRKKTPQEMRENPSAYLDPQDDPVLQEAQRRLDDTWQSAEEPKGRDKPPGSGANEGSGTHDWGIEDNGSGKGPGKP